MGNIIHKLELTNKKLKCLKKTDEGMFLYNFRSFQKRGEKKETECATTIWTRDRMMRY